MPLSDPLGSRTATAVLCDATHVHDYLNGSFLLLFSDTTLEGDPKWEVWGIPKRLIGQNPLVIVVLLCANSTELRLEMSLPRFSTCLELRMALKCLVTFPSSAYRRF